MNPMVKLLPMFSGDGGLPENIGMLPSMEAAMGLNHERTGDEKIKTRGGPLPQINLPGDAIFD